MSEKIRAYQKLATLYDKGGWSEFSLRCLELFDTLFKKHNFSPQVIIDVACGTGNLIAELHKRNYNVIGVDISPEMIKVARKNNPNVEFIVGDMQDMELNIQADLVTCIFDSTNYLLNDIQLNKAFNTINKYLKPTGFFLFDVNTPLHYRARHHGTLERDIDNVKFKQILEYDRETKIAKTTFDFGDDQIEEHIQKAFSRDEVETALLENRFELVDVFQDFELNPPNDESERLFFFAQKTT